MPKLQHRETGSVVDVPDEKVDRLYPMGYDVLETKAPAKKAASSKSDTK